MKNHPFPIRFLPLLSAGCLLLLSAGNAFAAAEIAVEQPPGTDLTSDVGTKSFGAVAQGANSSLTFTIKNPGDANLTGLGISFTGSPGDFSVTAAPTAPVAATNFTTFTVRFAPTTYGTRNAKLNIASNDADEDPFIINLTGTGNAPDIAVEQPPGTNLVDGVGSTAIGSFDLGTPPSSPPSKVFTIKNLGNVALTGLTISKAGTHPADFTVSAVTPGTPALGTNGTGSSTFSVDFSPSSSGPKSAIIQIASNDPDEASFEINVTGTATAPHLKLEQPVTAEINPGDTKDFGPILIGSTSKRTFTITNTGTSPLTGLTITKGVTGNPADFSVSVVDPPAPLAVGASATFQVDFTPSGSGSRTAVLQIASNDPDPTRAPFTLNLSGNGGIPAEGSDSFGYRYTETLSNSVVLNESDPDVVVASNLIGDDTAQAINLGFTFYFYENAYSSCAASTNGLITFGGLSSDYSPDPIPSNNPPNNYIAPFWTDLIKGTASKILYATRGTAPNRIFIIDYQNMEQYNNAATETVSFQVLLYEGTNAIEIQLKSKAATFDMTRPITVGIENPLGTIGIRYPSNTGNASPYPVPTFPKAITFTRPVVVDVESKYLKPDGRTVACSSTAGLTVGMTVTGTNIQPGSTITAVTNDTHIVLSQRATGDGAGITLIAAGSTSLTNCTVNLPTPADVGTPTGGLVPGIGTISEPYGSVKRFEAPEFIYLDKNFNELPGVGQFVDENQPGTALYRLVNDGYAIDGQVIQGTQTFFTATLTRDITVIWRWKLEYAAIVQAFGIDGLPLQVGEGVGNPSPALGRSWVPKDTAFNASIDRAVGNDSLGLDVAGFRYSAKSYGFNLPSTGGLGTRTESPAVPLGPTGNRVSTSTVTITDWVRVKWTMAAQVRYRFDAAGLNGAEGSSAFLGQSFVRVYKVGSTTEFEVSNPVNGPNPQFGNGTMNEIWIDAGRKVDVGAFYRTIDRRFTVGNFVSFPGGNLSAIGSDISIFKDEVMADGAAVDRVARIYSVAAASAPSEIHFLYTPTVFRAEVALGQSLDSANPNVQLVPDLPDNAVLRAADLGPTEAFTRVGPLASGLAIGQAVRWDRLGKSLLPVQPGSFQLDWPDSNTPATTYKIEVVTGYPGDNAQLASARETQLPSGDSVREVSSAAFVFNTLLPRVDSDFPGSVASPLADAHYRHVYDTNPARQVPTKLDIRTSDEWSYREMPYTDATTGASVDTTSTKGFKVTGSGRSVLLYSYRPNPDEAADGTLTKERLAVRIVRSNPLTVVPRTDSKLVLGQHGLILGNGSPTSGGAYGVVQNGLTPATTSVVPGDKFVMDFWLNAKGLKSSAPVTLTGGATVVGSPTVTCASTAGLVADMMIAGTNIPAGSKIKSVTNGTTLVLSAAATGTTTGLTFTASNKPVIVLNTGTGGLKVTLDSQASTITANFRGVPVTHPLAKAGAGWRHYAVHVFTSTLFGTGVTVVDFYRDGVRKEQSFVTSWFPGSSDSTVAPTVGDSSLRIGVNADPGNELQFDQFRLFSLGGDLKGYLSGGEIRRMRTERDMTLAGKQLRSVSPQLWFSFESSPSAGKFPNLGTLANVAVGPVSGSSPFAETWSNADLQEVATRLDSTLDNAAFGGSGYVINAVSNYNAELYNRNAEVGTWGPVFPVNHYQLFTAATKKLEVAYYENPWLVDRLPNPNVAWPYVATEYKDVVFPTVGPDKNKRIYIASRIGSEGVDQNGSPQEVFDLAEFSGLKIYNQPVITSAGYNPNEEHALVAASGRAAVKVKNFGDGIPNNPPLAAFALQADANNLSGYTSDTWVLVQVNNLKTGEPEMAAYAVRKTRTGTIPFPRPTDAQVQSTPGLAYESAANPEDRFLTLDPAKTFPFEYKFDYPVFAGDLVIPPYPLNLVIGNVAMQDERGGNIQVGGLNQRTLWRDVNKKAWVVSGNGRFFNQFFYPMRGDFYLATAPAAGTPVAWVPDVKVFTGTGTSLEPVKVVYNSKWRSDYPKLKRGETLTYQGGEYFNENPGSNGLPALVAMKAAELIYDSSTPSMVIRAEDTASPNIHGLADVSARVMRPLDRREGLFTTAKMATAGFTPAQTDKLLIIAERWYFKALPGSLGNRFYYDTLAQKLVFRGRLNDKESGASDLTAGPDPLNLLEPNVMTPDEFAQIRDLSTNAVWQTAIGDVYKLSQNPNAVTALPASTTNPVNLQGIKAAPANPPSEATDFWTFVANAFGINTGSLNPELDHLDSFGVGSALVPSPGLLTKNPNGSLYVTIAENNRSELGGAAISLHIIEIVPDRYRGAIKVVESADAFSEKVMLLHNGEFGANTGDLYYEWWIRDSAPLDLVANEILPNGNLAETDAGGSTLWQQYLPKSRAENGSLTDTQKHLGLNSIVFEGRPDVTLADKLVMVRYRHQSESNWTLVPFEFSNPSLSWKPGNPAPFQWAGAANSPQLQADGSKRYVPQLVMGWVKRVLDRINPYEARYTDFFSNESPATYSSQIQIAGGPFAGKVALNSDKNVIENTGLIELYETVLQRAKELSIDNSSNPVSTDGINQALLLAATRLSVLYELLAREAYSDAQDSTITVADGDGLASVASFTHAFQNFEPDLMHEGLSLLRGTDFRKSYPVYNRLFWNYAKGLGEAAYNVNYNIYDENIDGFINEDDARALYPQGHGDAWGHFVNALNKHYDLLSAPNFGWRTRSELYSLMQNVLEVDFLDEKTFAKLAAGKARTGRDIVRDTYRLNYTQNPDGQWQGYTDGADPARAWGVSEWAHRAGQSAYFDWVVANSLLPDEASGATPVPDPQGLDRIDRLGAIDEIGEIAASFYEIQIAMDEADGGVNPLGFDSDAITFDLDLEFYENASGGDRRTHFEQIYERALVACSNASATLDFATRTENKLRRIADDTNDLTVEAMRQDMDYRNRLIEIFGRPYDGTIGFGKAYPEGYEGPDNFLYAYLDRTTVGQIIPTGNITPDDTTTLDFDDIKSTVSGLASNKTLLNLYDSRPNGSTELTNAVQTFILGNNYVNVTRSISMPVARASAYGFQAPAGWGQRTSYGKIQRTLEDMLREQVALKGEIDNYIGFLGDFETLVLRLQNQIELIDKKEDIADTITGVRAGINTAFVAAESVIGGLEIASLFVTKIADAINQASPSAIGFSNDVGAIPRGIAEAADIAASTPLAIAKSVTEIAKRIAELTRDETVAALERSGARVDYVSEIEGMMAEIEQHIGNDGPLRAGIGERLQALEILRQEYFTAQAEGFRLLREREAFNKVLASKVQKNRYQDMVVRLSRNEAMSKYQSTFNHAARYTWLAAKAYDYETSLDPGHPAAPGPIFDKIVKERQLGLWSEGQPQSGQGGLAEILSQLQGNFTVLKGQLGLGNPQPETEKISLRSELFRIGEGVANGGTAASDDRWKDALKARIVPDLNQMPEFVRYCRPFDTGAQPGIVIRFGTSIEPGLNFFGRELLPGDHNYSAANFATKVRGFGIWLENYNAAGLATTPRAYLVPVGNDFIRGSSSTEPFTRMWSIQEQRIPTPFVINPGNLTSPGFIPTLNGVNGGYGELRRHGDFRMYHDNGDPEADDSELIFDSRLIGRSVWNSEWMIIIPGAGLAADPATGLTKFAESVADIKLYFNTYSHQGQ